MDLYLVRHGETDFNREQRYMGFIDLPLNSTGRSQVLGLKKKLADLKPCFLWSSDLKRCRQTTELLDYNLPVHYTSALREINYGFIEGMTFREFREQYPAEEAKWHKNWTTYSFREGESYLQMGSRVLSFVEENKQEQSADCGIVITHGGCICALLSHYLCGHFNNFWKFRVGNGNFARLNFQDKDVFLYL